MLFALVVLYIVLLVELVFLDVVYSTVFFFSVAQNEFVENLVFYCVPILQYLVLFLRW